jgi:hypothetical protein
VRLNDWYFFLHGPQLFPEVLKFIEAEEFPEESVGAHEL